MSVVEKDITTLPSSQISLQFEDDEIRRQFLKSQAVEERLRRELEEAKKNLPSDKERLDIEELAQAVGGVWEYVRSKPESFEMDYYLFHPEIKSTQEFIQHIHEKLRIQPI